MSGRAPTPISTRTRRSTVPATPTPAQRPSPSTCPTMKSFSSRRAPGDCSSRTSMRAKFDRILVPIAGELIAEDQQSHAKFDAFFANVMFHEVAHGLGLTHTIDGKRTVRDALKEQHSALEEGKADILGFTWSRGCWRRASSRAPRSRTTTSRSSRASSARSGSAPATPMGGQRRAALVLRGPRRVRARQRNRSVSGGFPEDAVGGRLSRRVELKLQGDGDYEGVKQFMAKRGVLSSPSPATSPDSVASASRWTWCSTRARPCSD